MIKYKSFVSLAVVTGSVISGVLGGRSGHRRVTEGKGNQKPKVRVTTV